MPLLRLNDISLSFGGPPLLDNVTLQIEAGERIGLVGPKRLRQVHPHEAARRRHCPRCEAPLRETATWGSPCCPRMSPMG